MKAKNDEVKVLGKTIDHQTRCIHYHTSTDIIAIKFKCCGNFYPCYSCHEETAGHQAQQWPRSEWNEKAILCGACNHQLTIEAYMHSDNQCPSCGASFNPSCRKHYHLYFDL